ncbi:hypothetical protein CLRAG_21410 [Clostridium ragsdalei P11]|uniref:Uncharacterized protein n=1 Tax=Clostridium ragsdalei P11 TaxID=1353534 RepID=A0A1A6AS29_9CLOT|nr:hypothetical protein [Clostridium ragsdalei]OBR92848.1 hypothetical protein CLRAG_21410 [Clostridium ragsdalei P11]
MAKILTRYDILVKSEKNQMNLDFILNSTDKKVICGTVWNDDLKNPERVPEALVQVFRAGKNYEKDPLDIKLIGYVITDASGQFLVGPFETGTMIIFKIFKFWGNKNDSSEYCEASFQISGEHIEKNSGEEQL